MVEGVLCCDVCSPTLFRVGNEASSIIYRRPPPRLQCSSDTCSQAYCNTLSRDGRGGVGTGVKYDMEIPKHLLKPREIPLHE